MQGDTTDIRCTAWEKEGTVKRLVLNIGKEPFEVKLDGKTVVLQPFEVQII
jgi:hypothetical protein